MKIIFLAIAIGLSVTGFSQAKPEPKDTATYFLPGKLDDFKALFAAINSPDDISNNERKALAKWIQQRLFTVPKDTVAKKPK